MAQQVSKIPKLSTMLKAFDLTPARRKEAWIGYIFIALWLFGFFAFTFFPTIFTMLFSFMEMKNNVSVVKTLASPEFVGFKNWIHFFNDPQIGRSLFILLKYSLIALPVGVGLPLALALLMNSKHLVLKNIYRSLFYMPYIIPFIAALLVWGGMLNPASGWINRVLLMFGMPKGSLPQWANDPNTVYLAYTIMGLWGVGQPMLIMLAGLQGVPTELYDAASMDGANGWQKFWNVTFPMMSPVIFFSIVLNIVGLFQFLILPLVLNQGNGNPAGSTMFYTVYLYKTLFQFQDMSYGSTLAWGLFVVILIVTLVLFVTSKYWVYYAGDTNRN